MLGELPPLQLGPDLAQIWINWIQKWISETEYGSQKKTLSNSRTFLYKAGHILINVVAPANKKPKLSLIVKPKREYVFFFFLT